MKKNLKEFNIVIAGVGGQGLITLLEVLAEAAIVEGYDLKTSELHGLAQRGGSVEVHIRFGKEIFSPLVSQGKADLILGLEMAESLRAVYFASPQTTFLINKFIIPVSLEKSSPSKIFKNLKKFSKKIILIPATNICQKKVGTFVTAGIYLLGYAIFKKLIPLKSNSIIKAIEKIIPQKYLEINLKTFNLAKLR